jgi:hypothetical protein
MRPVTVTAGPFSAAVATAVALAQTAPGAGQLAINGTLAAAQWIGTASLAATGLLSVTGNTQGAVSVGSLSPLALSGLGVPANAVLWGPGPVANSWWSTVGAVVASETMYLGAVAKIGVAQQITFTTSSTDAGKTATVYGTDWAGNPISETVTLASTATVNSVLSYATVTQVVISAATTGTVSVGTAGFGSSPWVRLDDFAPGPVSLTFAVNGTITYSLQQTDQDPSDPTNPVAPAAMVWLASSDATTQAASTNIKSQFAQAPRFARVITTAGAGSVAMTVAQQGAVPY